MRNVLLVPRIGCYVYAYLRSQSSEHGEAGTPYYVGKGKHGRGFYARAFDKNHNIHLPSDRSNVIILSDNMTDNDARQTEMFLIYRYGRIDLGTGCLRNLTDGGEGCEGRVVTEETRAKQSVSRKGKKMPPWTEERRSLASLRVSGSGNPFYGRKHSEESMIRASSTRKLNETGLENIRKAAQARKGTHPSEETRQKLREAGKRRIFSDETRRKISAANTGKQRRTDVPDSELVRLYSAGLSCATIASFFDTTKSTVSWRLRKAGTLMRPVGDYSQSQRSLQLERTYTKSNSD